MKRIVWAIVIALTLVVVIANVMQAQVVWPDQNPPAIVSKKTLIVYPAATATASTVYGSAFALENYRKIDLFSTVDVSGTAQSVVSLQFSADGKNWADADFTWDKLTGTGSVVSNSGGMTDTISYLDAITSQAWSITLAADGTDFITLPTIGEFMRVKVVSTRSNADNSNTTVRATFKQ